MRAPARLGLYGLVLAAVFAIAFAVAGAVVPRETAEGWAEGSEHPEHSPGGEDPSVHAHDESAAAALGLGQAEDGYRLTGLSAPARVGEDGELSLTVIGPDGRPLTGFDEEHEQRLHLIVVREDGQRFRHVHPSMAEDGTWSIPWRWDAAGSYRVIADAVPSGAGQGVVLSSAAQVAGDYAPVPAEPAASTAVDGYEVSLAGDLVAGESSRLTLEVTREGRPVTTLEPYLGAFGHLVALREGDLAYLHVHPLGEDPEAGETSGPEIAFEATAPAEGRYLLYLDFKVDGRVHTAPLVLDAGTHPDDTHPSGATEHEEAQHDHG